MEMKHEAFEPKLVPLLREGINVIKMVLYVELKPVMTLKYSEMDTEEINLLTGAVVNSLFGIQNMEEPFATFEKDNRILIERELREISKPLDHLKIPVTDALRIQFLCDGHEGVDSASVLEKANDLNFLILERDVPMPGAFMSIVRRFGAAYRILEPHPG